MIKVLMSGIDSSIEAVFSAEGFVVIRCGTTSADVRCAVRLHTPQVLMIKENRDSAKIASMFSGMTDKLKIFICSENNARDVFMECNHPLGEITGADLVSVIKFSLIESFMNDELELPELEDYRSYIIRNALADIGLTANYSGYKYVDSILNLICTNKISDRETMEKHVYPLVAAEKGTTREGVERSIRTAITNSWRKTGVGTKAKYFGLAYADKEKAPTNREFLFIIGTTLSYQIQRHKNILRDEILFRLGK